MLLEKRATSSWECNLHLRAERPHAEFSNVTVLQLWDLSVDPMCAKAGKCAFAKAGTCCVS